MIDLTESNGVPVDLVIATKILIVDPIFKQFPTAELAREAIAAN